MARGQPFDREAARELEIFMDNDQGIYRRRLEFEKAAAKKMCSGKYDPAKAPKLFGYLATEAAKEYDRQFSGHDWGRIFSPATRSHVATALAREFEERVREHKAGKYHDLAPEVAALLDSPKCRR